MPKPPNVKLRNKVLEYIKLECMRQGGPISPPLTEIAVAIGEDPKKAEKILRMVNSLERRGNIKIYRGEGSLPNKYEFISDNVVEILGEAKNQITEDLDELINEVNKILKKIIDYAASISKKNIELAGQVQYYENSFAKLEPFGVTPEGKEIYITTEKSSSLPLILEEIKKKQANKEIALIQEEEKEEEKSE